MRLKIKVKPKSRTTRVEKAADGSLKVWVKAAPEKGRANEEVIESLSEYLDIPKSRISVASGHTSSQKTIDISS